jgi:MFS superfamily sulfate permease-like transporter
MRSVPAIDATGLHSLETIIKTCKKQGKTLNTQPKSQAEKNMPYEDRLGAAVLDVEACNSVDELTAIWHAYKADFGEDARFVDALKDRKAALNK